MTRRGLALLEWASALAWLAAWAVAALRLADGDYAMAALAGLSALGFAMVRDTARDYARERSPAAEAHRRVEHAKGFKQGFKAGVAFERDRPAGDEGGDDEGARA